MEPATQEVYFLQMAYCLFYGKRDSEFCIFTPLHQY